MTVVAAQLSYGRQELIGVGLWFIGVWVFEWLQTEKKKEKNGHVSQTIPVIDYLVVLDTEFSGSDVCRNQIHSIGMALYEVATRTLVATKWIGHIRFQGGRTWDPDTREWWLAQSLLADIVTLLDSNTSSHPLLSSSSSSRDPDHLAATCVDSGSGTEVELSLAASAPPPSETRQLPSVASSASAIEYKTTIDMKTAMNEFMDTIEYWGILARARHASSSSSGVGDGGDSSEKKKNKKEPIIKYLVDTNAVDVSLLNEALNSHGKPNLVHHWPNQQNTAERRPYTDVLSLTQFQTAVETHGWTKKQLKKHLLFPQNTKAHDALADACFIGKEFFFLLDILSSCSPPPPAAAT